MHLHVNICMCVEGERLIFILLQASYWQVSIQAKLQKITVEATCYLAAGSYANGGGGRKLTDAKITVSLVNITVCHIFLFLQRYQL